MGSHGAVASQALGDALTQAVLDDYHTAPIDGKLRATLAYLEKMTKTPESLGPDDARAVYAEGVSEAALVDAVYICALFNLIDRVADALGFDIPADFSRGAPMQLKRGYKF